MEMQCEPVERFARAIIETMHEPFLIVLDPTLRVSFANRSFFRHFRTNPEETVGRFLYEIGPQWDVPAFRELLEKIISLDHVIEDYEIRYEFPLLGEKVLVLNARRLQMNANEPAMILMAIEDITERVTAQEDLQKVQNQLEEIVRQRTEESSRANEQLKRAVKLCKEDEENIKKYAEQIKLFSYSISHDLKNPAVTINLMAQRLIKSVENASEKDREYLKGILETSNQMISLVEKIHDFILVREKKTNLEIVRAEEVFHELHKEFFTILESRKIKWVESGCAEEVYVDKLAIIRALRNLVGNSMEHGGENLNRIEVGCTESEGFHVLFVKDDGNGLNENCRQEIFEPFQHKNRICGGKGLGLGLSIVKETANMHGGDAWFEPNPDGGVTFHMSVRK